MKEEAIFYQKLLHEQAKAWKITLTPGCNRDVLSTTDDDWRKNDQKNDQKNEQKNEKKMNKKMKKWTIKWSKKWTKKLTKKWKNEQ